MALSAETLEIIKKRREKNGIKGAVSGAEEREANTQPAASSRKSSILSDDTVKLIEEHRERKNNSLRDSSQDAARTGAVTVVGNQDLGPVKNDVTADPDYTKKAAEGLASFYAQKNAKAEKEGNKKWWQRLLEANMQAHGMVSDSWAVTSMNAQAQYYREDTSYREPSDKWTADQKNMFGYLYSTNPAQASLYAQEVNKSIQNQKKEEVAKEAGESVLKSTGEALLKAPTALGDFFDNLAEFSGRHTITQKDHLTFSEEAQAIQSGIAEKLNGYGTIPEKVPIVGGKGLGDLYGLGFSGAQSLLAGATKNSALTLLQFFGQAAAAGVDEKLAEGASAQQAILYGLVAGTAEAVAEKIGIDNLFKNSGAQTMRGVLKNMLKQGTAEGLEEMITSVLNNISERLIMGKDSRYSKAVAEYSKTMSESQAKWKAFGDMLEEIAFDGLGGFLTGGGNTMVMTGATATKNAAAGKTAISGLTQNEQQVVDKVYEALVAEEAKNSKDGKVSAARKSELFEEAIKAMDQGTIDIETIEEVLGGEDYKAYLEEQEKENEVLMELEALYKGEELQKQQQGIRDNSTLSQMRQTVSDKVAELVKSERLAESYREKARRSQAFQADMSRYDEKQRAIVQKAVDSGVLNNTNRSHELVDLIAKIGADKELDFDFTNNKKLKESGFALEGKTVNGFVSDSGVTVNVNSAKALNSVVGHEVTHVLEGTQFYEVLEKAVTEYARSKGEYDTRLRELRAIYSTVQGYAGADGHRKIEKELVADLVGDYLFTDSDFINRLSTGNRTLFVKLFDEVKYLCRVATAGSKEAKQLEKVKKAFEDAYRQDAKNTAEDGGVRYTLAKVEDVTPTNEQKIENIRKVAKMQPVYTVDASKLVHGKKSINEIYREFFTEWGENIHSDIFGDIAVKNSSIRSEMRHGSTPVKVASIEAIPSVIRNGKIVEWIEKKSGLFRIVVAAPIKIGDTPYFMGVMLQRDAQNQRLYLHDVVIEEEASNPTQEHLDSTGPYEEHENLYTSSILDKIGEVKRKDLEYQYAVKKGDVRAAQKLVDEAARAAGYTIKAYHGTDAGTFTVFDKGKIGDASGLSILGDGFYFADKKSVAAQYGKNVYTVYLKQLNPYSATDRDAYKLNAAKLERDGFDSVTLPTGKGAVYMVLDPEQIKSADPITYDDDGNVIPLSERFNQEKEDIRYSLSRQEDIGTVKGRIYGKDVALEDVGPVREDLQTEEDAEGEYDDLPFEFPEGLDKDGEYSGPVTTVAQRLGSKMAALRRELAANEQNRKASAEEYDRKIQELRERYEAKKHKHSKAANAILRQISKQESQKAQRDAEFEKRIHDIRRRIDKTMELMRQDHSREDRLERQLRQLDEQLEQDKKALEAEIEGRREKLKAEVGDRNAYISKQAGELYREIRNHVKGTPFSEPIYILYKSGHGWQQIKEALLLVERHPERKNAKWAVEVQIRKLLEDSYGNKVYELEHIDEEYQNRMNALEEEAKETKQSFTVAAQRKIKQQQMEQEMEELVGDTSTWKDKKLGIQYQTNTLRRNLWNVVRDEKGRPDIAKADAIYDALQGRYNTNEAELKKESARIKQPFRDMKITEAEDVYIQMLGEFKYNPETELSEQTVQDFLEEHRDEINTEKVDRIIEMSRKTYDDLLIRVNAALREMGMREIPYRKGYFPHFTEEAKSPLAKFLEKRLNFKFKSNEIPTSIAGRTEEFTPNRSYQHFDKTRTSDTTAYSFTKGMDSYVHGALDWIYHMEDIQRRRALENHIRYVHSEEGVKAKIDAVKENNMLDADQVQEEIDKILKEAGNPLNNFVTDLRTGTNILAGKKNSMDRGMEQTFNRSVYSFMTNVSGRVSANQVAGSISSALTNFIPITQSWGEVSPKTTLRAMADTIVSYMDDDGIVEKSVFLTNRLRPEENLHKTGWDKAGEKVAWMMEAVDNFTSQTVWRSKYLENLSQGMSENEAIKNADEFAEGLIAGRSRGNMPTLFDAKNPLAKVLTAFQLEVNNQYGYMLKDMPNSMRNEYKRKLVMGYAKMFLGAYAYNALYSSLTGRDAAFDPIGILEDLLRSLGWIGDEEEEKPGDIIKGFAENVAEELPFIGGLIGGGRIPLSSAMPYGEGPIEMITGTAQDIANKNWGDLTWEWMNPAFYVLMPFGGGQLRKTAKGVSMFLGDKPVTGSYTSSGNLRFPVAPNALNFAQAAIFGEWASGNAREYIENGRSPIGKGQIQDYIDSGLTYQEYWNRKDSLKQLEADFKGTGQVAAFYEEKDILEEAAAAENAGDIDLLREKYFRIVAGELNDILGQMQDLIDAPLAENIKAQQMDRLMEDANRAAENAMREYRNVSFDMDYARIGDMVWKRNDDGAWDKLSGQELAKYEAIHAAGDEPYAIAGDIHYRKNTMGQWVKITDDQLEKQNAVTQALGITPEEYWGDRREEYIFAYEKPGRYQVARAVGGYDSFAEYTKQLNNLSADKDQNGKSINGSRKNKVIDYINGLELSYGEKLILFKSEYPADDRYNEKILEYLKGRDDLSSEEIRMILQELEFEVLADGTVGW